MFRPPPRQTINLFILENGLNNIYEQIFKRILISLFSGHKKYPTFSKVQIGHKKGLKVFTFWKTLYRNHWKIAMPKKDRLNARYKLALVYGRQIGL